MNTSILFALLNSLTVVVFAKHQFHAIDKLRDFEKVAHKWDEHGGVIPTKRYLNSKRYEMLEWTSIDRLKVWVKEAIQDNTLFLAFCLGISEPSDMETFYDLSGPNFLGLIKYLRQNLFETPSFDKIKDDLGDACNPGIEKQIKDFLDRAQVVKGIALPNIDLIFHTFDLEYPNAFPEFEEQQKVLRHLEFDKILGEEFYKRLKLTKMFSRPKLFFFFRAFNDARIKELFEDKLGKHYFRLLVFQVRSMSEEEFTASSYSELIGRPLNRFKRFTRCLQNGIRKMRPKPRANSLNLISRDVLHLITEFCLDPGNLEKRRKILKTQ